MISTVIVQHFQENEGLVGWKEPSKHEDRVFELLSSLAGVGFFHFVVVVQETELET